MARLGRRTFLQRVGAGLVAFVPAAAVLLDKKQAQAQQCGPTCQYQTCYCYRCTEGVDEGTRQYYTVAFYNCYDLEYENHLCSSPAFTYQGAVCNQVC